MNKFELIKEELAQGRSYQLELLKLLCEIAERLKNIEKYSIPDVFEKSYIKEEPVKKDIPIGSITLVKDLKDLEPEGKKRWRPPKKRR